MDMEKYKCVNYGFTMIDSEGNVLNDILDYEHVSMICISNINKMCNLPLDLMKGDGYTVPDINSILTEFKSSGKKWIEYHGKVYVAIPDHEYGNAYFMDITNQVKTLQLRVIRYFPPKKEE